MDGRERAAAPVRHLHSRGTEYNGLSNHFDKYVTEAGGEC